MSEPLNDDDLLKLINGLINDERLLITLDESGEPFYPVNHVTLSLHTPAELAAGAKRKVILWYHAEDAITDGEAIYKP